MMNLPDVLLLAFLYLGLPVGFAVGLYWIVRLAIRHETQQQAHPQKTERTP